MPAASFQEIFQTFNIIEKANTKIYASTHFQAFPCNVGRKKTHYIYRLKLHHSDPSTATDQAKRNSLYKAKLSFSFSSVSQFSGRSCTMVATFTARRSSPELVTPARPTPRETKLLSDLDDQWTLRYYETVVGFFRVSPKMAGGLPGGDNIAAKVIKAAVAEALVHYYPVAGRLRALVPGGNKLAVDCTAEGVAFVEATADVRLEELGEPLLPPYPCVEEFLGDAGDTRDILDKPLLFLQVYICLN